MTLLGLNQMESMGRWTERWVRLGINSCIILKLNLGIDMMDQSKVGSLYIALVQFEGFDGLGPPHHNNYYCSISLPEPKLALLMT